MFNVSLTIRQGELIEALLRSYVEDSPRSNEPLEDQLAASTAMENISRARLGL